MSETSKKFYENHALIRVRKCCYEKLKAMKSHAKEGVGDVIAKLVNCNHNPPAPQVPPTQ